MKAQDGRSSARFVRLLAVLAAAIIALLLAAGNAVAAPAPAAAPAPDLSVSIPPDSDEDTPYPLGTDIEIDYLVVVRSTVDSATNTVTITVPKGLDVDVSSGVYRYDGDNGKRLRCTRSGDQYTCPLGAVPANRSVEVDVPLVANKTAPAGTSGQFTIAAAPDTGTDPNPDNNSVTGTANFLGTAHMDVAITAPRRTVTVGHELRVRITVTNLGPQPAPATLGFLGLEEFLDGNFSVVDFSGRDVGTGGGGIGIGGIGVGGEASAGGAQSADRSGSPLTEAKQKYRKYRHSGEFEQHRGDRGAQARAHDLDPLLFWDAGDLAPGKSTSAIMTVRADEKGKGTVFAFGFSDAGDPACNTDEADPEAFEAPPGCDGFDELTLHAVKPAPKMPPRTPSAGDGPLAATGPHTAGQAEIGGALVLSGTLLVLLGRRRRRS